MIIFWHPTGPLVKYSEGILHMSTLNPDLQISWRMSRGEMLLSGLRFILAAFDREIRWLQGAPAQK